jgi:signal transduction histidine kinase
MAMEQLALQDVVGDVVSAAEPLALAHGVRLRATADPVGMRADGKELARALSNLVVNAIRHTPDDGTVVVEAGPDANGSVLLTVTDGCGGIPQPDLDRVFEVGWRGTSARTPSPDDGAGLGLSIVRGIVEAHQGQVAVRNVDGGCMFEVRLPLGQRA